MRPKILLIDNYDSFTYNLVQAFLVLGAVVEVHRNDAITTDEALELNPSHLVISPGPGTPRDAGVSMPMIRAFAGRIPIFGVCLGHQSLVEVFGGKVVRAARLMHGKVSPVMHDGKGLYVGMPREFEGRPLSLADRGRRQHSAGARHHGANRGRRDHGRSPQVAADRRRAIPPGKRAHAGWSDSHGQFSEDLKMATSPHHTLDILVQGRDLAETEAAALLTLLTTPEVAPAMAGALLTALRAKGVTAAEVRGFAGAMRSLARKPALPEALDAIDIVGTGGDASGSLNLFDGRSAPGGRLRPCPWSSMAIAPFPAAAAARI